MTEKPYSSKNLDDIRKRIDTLDNNIHDMLMERAELVLKVGEEKRKNNIQIVQPAREARMIRRLLSRHKGVLPEMAVVRIWRELVGAVSLLQTGLKVAVAVEEGQDNNLWELARDYFGSCLPFQKSGSALSAVAAVRDGRVTFAVVPWPHDDEDQPWWEYLKDNNPSDRLKINIRLPHGDDPKKVNPDYKALVVSKTGFDSSDDDCSFLLIECNSTYSRGKIVELAEKADLKPKSLATKRRALEMDPSLHFLEVEEFIGDDDERLTALKGELGGEALVLAVGGYPVPPVYSKTIQPRDNDIPSAAPRKEAG